MTGLFWRRLREFRLTICVEKKNYQGLIQKYFKVACIWPWIFCFVKINVAGKEFSIWQVKMSIILNIKRFPGIIYLKYVPSDYVLWVVKVVSKFVQAGDSNFRRFRTTCCRNVRFLGAQNVSKPSKFPVILRAQN